MRKKQKVKEEHLFLSITEVKLAINEQALLLIVIFQSAMKTKSLLLKLKKRT